MWKPTMFQLPATIALFALNSVKLKMLFIFTELDISTKSNVDRFIFIDPNKCKK
jgi:hypothetical protein